jgi:hypothetical protein
MTEAIVTIVAIYTYEGAGTIYLGPEGNPLFCDRGNGLIYSRDTENWVAFPKYLFDLGLVRCGDLVHILEYLPDGTTRATMARIYDAGGFGPHTTIGGMPIVVDAPPWVATWPLYPGFARVRVMDLSAIARECREMGLCD